MKTFNENIVRLIQLALSGELNEREREELEAWCREKKENKEFYDVLCQEKLFSREFPIYRQIDEEKAMQCFEKTMSGKYLLLKRLARYAAILILPLLGMAVWQWNSRQHPVEVVTQSIIPGSSKAVLILSGGQQVSLVGQEQQSIEVLAGIQIKQQAGLLSYDSLAPQNVGKIAYNTLSTGRGGEYSLVLADGTKVFLNAVTTLKYPVVFNEEVRKVQLDGEAYFEVAKDAARAFIVETKGIEVKVYGTSFNINTLHANEIQTVLVEGNIGIRSVATDREYRVRPGQMAVWKQTDNTVELQEVDVTLYTAWKEGIFRFDRQRLEDILNTLVNWYDVEVFYQSQDIKNLHFSGYMERYDQIDVILEAITEATGVRFAVQGRTIIVSK